MLRSEIIGAVKNLAFALGASRIMEALRTEIQNENSIELLLSSYSKFLSFFSPPSPAEKRLLDILQISPLLEPEWWGKLMVSSKEDRSRQARMVMMRNVDFLVDKLPQIAALLERQQIGFESEERLNLIISETEGQTSTPERITAAIESVSLIYRALCRLHLQPENTLALRTCDSGSDKSFDFTGIPQIIGEVKATIFGIVDRVIFFRERQFSERVKCVAESLPILGQITEMVESKKISPEQGELLRRDLVEGATKFLETGSSIPELKISKKYDPDSLISSTPTLLLEGPDGARKRTPDERNTLSPKSRLKRSPPARRNKSEHAEVPEAPDANDGLSREEVQRLRDLIRNEGRSDK